MAVLASIAVGVGLYFVAQKVGQAITMDPARVQTLAEQLLPGAKAPDGYQGLMGLDIPGLQAAVISPKHEGDAAPGECNIIIARVPQSKDINVEKLRSELSEKMTGQSGNEKVLTQERMRLQVGGKPVEAVRTVEDDKGQKSDSIIAAFLDDQEHLVIVIANGPSQDFEKAPTQAFFDGIDMSKLKSIDPSEVEASPSPDVSGSDDESPDAPEEPETPEDRD